MTTVGISIHPKLLNGDPVTSDNLLSTRLDRDQGTIGVIEEYSAWSAALKFFTDSAASGGLDKTIPTVPYDLSVKRMIAQ